MPRLREPPKQGEEEIEKPEIKQQEVAAAVDDGGAAEDMKRQLDALRSSEAAARQERDQIAQQRDQAVRIIQERNVALSRSQSEATSGRLDAINSGIAAATSEIEEAKQAFRMGAAQEDIEAQIAAQEKLAEAKANLINLTNGKTALERAIAQQAEQNKQQQLANQQQPQQQGDQLDRTNLPQTAKNWLRAHPDYLTDPRKNAKIQALHWDVLDENHAPFSDAYYVSLEEKLGLRSKPRQEVAEDEYVEEPARPIVSAPVSRESHNSSGERNSGTIRLSAQQREMAAASGITEAEYAKQLVNLKKAKANGSYGGQP